MYGARNIKVKFFAFYRTENFLNVLRRSQNQASFWARVIQSTSYHPISLSSISLLSHHLCLVLPSGRLPSSFPTKFCMHFFVPLHVTFCILIVLHFIMGIIYDKIIVLCILSFVYSDRRQKDKIFWTIWYILQKSWNVMSTNLLPFFRPFWVASISDKCLISFWVGNVSDKCLSVRT